MKERKPGGELCPLPVFQKERMDDRKKGRIALVALFFLFFASVWYSGYRENLKILRIYNLETGEVYVKRNVKTGDGLSFGWIHSFEHIPWNEYYEIMDDGTFVLHTISVAGFGAGIPAEMDCPIRFEDGLIYMDEIESTFPQFNWINSQTALQWIALDGETLITGADMPHHKKIVLKIN